MSAEDTGQPPTGGADKAPPAKPAAAFTSSFINKNTTGKKFAPKAARRRPGAAPAAAAPKPAPPAPTPPIVEAQTTQPEPEPSNAPSEVTAAQQLPTPAATQEPSTQHVHQPTANASEATSTATAAIPSQPSVPTITEPLPTPPSTSTAPPVTDETPTATPLTTRPALAVDDEADASRAAKRRRLEPPAPKGTAATDTVVDAPAAESTQSAQPEVDASVQPPQETTDNSVVEQVSEPTPGAQSIDTGTTGPAPEVPGAMRPCKRRTLPWVSVNRLQEAEEDEAAPAPAKKTRKPPKPRGRKDATATTEEQEAGQEGAEGDEAQTVRKRPGAKARGKRKADAAVDENGAEVPAPTKRARRPRKVKSKETVTDADAEEGAEAVEGEAEAQAEDVGEPVVRRKPRAPRRKKRTSTEVEGEDGQDPAQPKRKGRPPREPTPSDAEDQEIDPEVTYMDSIASRNIRVGKLSARERAMREIDWVAVKQRQREEDSRKIDSRADREAAEKLQIEEAPQIDGPRYIMVDGQIQIQHDSTMINREADADREIENYEIVEERDLTTRITSRSFLKNNKRFPNDFILPGQGKRWTAADTELFYEGLQHFGTDFQMISHMFPGSTRRSMKLKFTREERDNPVRVREILLSRSTIVSHWDNFMQVSQMDEEKFANADEIKREMADEEADFRARIEAAKAETAERKRQQREAGLLDDEDENGNPIDKENGKGKKKRKGKEKQVTFQEDDGVEILGNVDDDDTWGQE